MSVTDISSFRGELLPDPPPLTERIFIGRTPSQALEYAEALVSLRAEVVAFDHTRDADFELHLVELREALAAKAKAEARVIAQLNR